MLRERRVMLDADLTQLYEVETRTLVQAAKRNTGHRAPIRGMAREEGVG